MGVALKSAFWLGLLYWAMPLGRVATVASVPGTAAVSRVADQFASIAAGRAVALGADEQTAAKSAAADRKSPAGLQGAPPSSITERRRGSPGSAAESTPAPATVRNKGGAQPLG
jgi:hypothetical protein